jgi:hypothetical protein
MHLLEGVIATSRGIAAIRAECESVCLPVCVLARCRRGECRLREASASSLL